jgi:hypothetical protein
MPRQALIALRLVFVAPADRGQIETVARFGPDCTHEGYNRAEHSLDSRRNSEHNQCRISGARLLRCSGAVQRRGIRSPLAQSKLIGTIPEPEAPAESGLTNRWSGEKKSASSPQPFA